MKTAGNAEPRVRFRGDERLGRPDQEHIEFAQNDGARSARCKLISDR